MGYSLHIERDGGFSLDEWKQAVASVPGTRLDDEPVTITNPATGDRITIPGQDGDVAVMRDEKWMKVFSYYDGSASFRAPISMDASADATMQVAVALAHILSAKVVGEGGEEYA